MNGEFLADLVIRKTPKYPWYFFRYNRYKNNSIEAVKKTAISTGHAFVAACPFYMKRVREIIKDFALTQLIILCNSLKPQCHWGFNELHRMINISVVHQNTTYSTYQNFVNVKYSIELVSAPLIKGHPAVTKWKAWANDIQVKLTILKSSPVWHAYVIIAYIPWIYGHIFDSYIIGFSYTFWFY